MLPGYRLYAQAEGKSPKTISTVSGAVTYLDNFLKSQNLSCSITSIGPAEIRAFIVNLQQRRPFESHPFARAQQRKLSPHSINSYLRSIRAFWSWLISEELLYVNPFSKVKIPKAPRKVVVTLSPSQIKALLDQIDNSTTTGLRDTLAIIIMLDSALRVSEATSLRLANISLEEGTFRIMGKGGKERIVPFGRCVKRLLWRYIGLVVEPRPSGPLQDLLFLTTQGLPLPVGHLYKRMKLYSKRAGICGVRCSPHTLRHTAAISFLRNGGDVFSLQRLLGHSSLAMTRHYCELADIDVIRAHSTASPVDNLMYKGKLVPKTMPKLRVRRL